MCSSFMRRKVKKKSRKERSKKIICRLSLMWFRCQLKKLWYKSHHKKQSLFHNKRHKRRQSRIILSTYKAKSASNQQSRRKHKQRVSHKACLSLKYKQFLQATISSARSSFLNLNHSWKTFSLRIFIHSKSNSHHLNPSSSFSSS